MQTQFLAAKDKTNFHTVISQFVEKLAGEVEAVKCSEPLLHYLKFAASFHDYSFHNCCLIFSQRPDASRVSGFHSWRKLGRHVKKGEKGIAILAPVTVKRRDEERKEEDVNPEVVTMFRTVYVFDVSQTEGADLPEAPVLTGADCNTEIGSALIRFADCRGITVHSEKLSGSAMGVSRGGSIAIDESLQGADYFAVLCHEVAHELLDHRNRRGELNKQAREIEAETVAYTICQHFSVPCTAPAYLALHGADGKEITEHLSAIVGVVHEIIRGIEDHIRTLGSPTTKGEDHEASVA